MQDEMFDEPGLDGPDYVALVIEWDALHDPIEDEVTTVFDPIPEPRRARSRTFRAIAVAGVLAAFGLMALGLRRLHAA